MTTQIKTYGKCPQCGGEGLTRERRPNGNDKCVNGHTYPSAKALSQPNEPVAYMYQHEDTGRVTFREQSQRMQEHRWYEIPLFSHNNIPSNEPVAYGILNTAITGKSNRLMSVRLEVPSDDQYGGALWKPLYLAPPNLEAKFAEVTADYKQQSKLVSSQGIRLMEAESDLAELTAKCEKMRERLTKIASLTQDTDLTWWQVEARQALEGV